MLWLDYRTVPKILESTTLFSFSLPLCKDLGGGESHSTDKQNKDKNKNKKPTQV
jgi:hypothetical protein